MIWWFIVGLMAVGWALFTAWRNISKRRGGRTNHRKALQEWEEFKQKHPGSDHSK